MSVHDKAVKIILWKDSILNLEQMAMSISRVDCHE